MNYYLLSYNHILLYYVIMYYTMYLGAGPPERRGLRPGARGPRCGRALGASANNAARTTIHYYKLFIVLLLLLLSLFIIVIILLLLLLLLLLSSLLLLLLLFLLVLLLLLLLGPHGHEPAAGPARRQQLNNTHIKQPNL